MQILSITHNVAVSTTIAWVGQTFEWESESDTEHRGSRFNPFRTTVTGARCQECCVGATFFWHPSAQPRRRSGGLHTSSFSPGGLGLGLHTNMWECQVSTSYSHWVICWMKCTKKRRHWSHKLLSNFRSEAALPLVRRWRHERNAPNSSIKEMRKWILPIAVMSINLDYVWECAKFEQSQLRELFASVNKSWHI